jgi:subtilisin family serine protease
MSNWRLSWHHVKLGIDSLWQQGITGRGVTVAVLDTGMARPPGLDNETFEVLDATGRAIAAYDPDGHGTYCASVIASYLGGALGIAPEAKIVSFRVLQTGNDAADVETALTYILQNRADVDVVSCSFNVGRATDTLRAAVKGLVNTGKVVVAAAGDSAAQPAEFPEQTLDTITVAAVDQQSLPLVGAQLGPWIDLSAPGRDLPAVAPGVNQVVLFSESSAATAVVSGVAALALSTQMDAASRASVGRGLEGLLRMTASAVAGVNPNAIGAGVVNPRALIQKIVGNVFLV